MSFSPIFARNVFVYYTRLKSSVFYSISGIIMKFKGKHYGVDYPS